VNNSEKIDSYNTTDDAVIRVLNATLHVSDDFYRTLVERARDRIPHLTFDEIYVVRDIVGSDYWGALKNPRRWLAGKVLAHLVAAKTLPLRFASCPYCTIKRYERT